MGVRDDLLPYTYDEAGRLSRFIALTQGPPDDDSRALVRALLDGPLRAAKTDVARRLARLHVSFVEGICRAQIGVPLAERLGVNDDRFRLALPTLGRTISVLERFRTGFSLDDFVERLGSSYWDLAVTQGLGGDRARFDLPRALSSGPRCPI